MISLLILIPICAFLLAAEAKKRGVDPKRCLRYTFTVGGILLLLVGAMNLGFRLFLKDLNSPLVGIYPDLLGLLGMGVFILWVIRAWRSLPKPPAS